MLSVFDTSESFVIEFGGNSGAFGLDDLMVDAAWAPLVGPTAIQLLRAMYIAVVSSEGVVGLDLSELGELIGVAPSRASHALESSHRHSLAMVDSLGRRIVLPRSINLPADSLLEELPVRCQRAARWCARQGPS